MTLPNGYLTLLPEGPSKVRVAWSTSSAGNHGPGEERVLRHGGSEITPARLRGEFEQARTDKSLQEIGRSLWQCVAGGRAGEERQAALQAENTRTVLDLSHAPAWQELPWEAFADDGGFLTRIPERPFVRLARKSPGSVVKGWPRRVLIVCGEDEDSDEVDVRAELAAIEDGMWERRREIICQVLNRPKKEELRTALRTFQPHVLHFIGHGDGLTLHVNAKKSWDIAAGDIREWFVQGRGPVPHLVFLNACRGAGGNGGDAMTPERYRSLTDAFLSNGVPAVIGMAGDVEGSAARIFATSFYEAWVAGHPLDVAMTVARTSVADEESEKPQQHLLAWLTVTTEPENWLHWEPISPDLEQVFRHPELVKVQDNFVDRNRERGQLFDEWLKAGAQHLDVPAAARVVVVHGEEQSGKTDIVRLVLKAMLTREWTARWQQMCDPHSVSWLEALRKLTDGGDFCGRLTAGLPPAAFEEFKAKAESTTLNIESLDDIHSTIQAWYKGLRNAAREAPVAIAIDKIGSGPPPLPIVGDPSLPPYLGHLTQGILKPLCQEKPNPAKPGSERILIVLVMSSREAEVYVPLIEEQISVKLGQVAVSTIAPVESKRALRQYFRQRMKAVTPLARAPDSDNDLQEMTGDFLKRYEKRRGNDLKASDLKRFFSTFKTELSELSLI